MANQLGGSPAPSGTGAPVPPLFPPAAGGSGVSPDIMQSLVDRAANLNIFSVPAGDTTDAAIYSSASNRLIGVKVREVLHRFSIGTRPGNQDSPLTAANIVGEPVGRFTHRWLLAPDDFVASPGRQPPPTVLDTSRSQRFVMLDSLCEFGENGDGFRGFGAGHTVVMNHGERSKLLVTAIGTILEGFGQFRGHEEGTYVYCGTLDVHRGFMGNLMLRVVDGPETFRTDNGLPELQVRSNPEPDVTYILFRGAATPSDAIKPRIGPGGQQIGLIVEQGLQLLNVDFAVHRSRGVQSTARVGQSLGKITATINFNPASPGGTALNPIPFTTFDQFVLTDSRGRRVGNFTGDSSEGRVFLTQISGQPGIRFGGIGKVLTGDGPFQGIKGLLTDNSVVVWSPHVSASVYVLRLYDPTGTFRAAAGV